MNRVLPPQVDADWSAMLTDPDQRILEMVAAFIPLIVSGNEAGHAGNRDPRICPAVARKARRPSHCDSR